MYFCDRVELVTVGGNAKMHRLEENYETRASIEILHLARSAKISLALLGEMAGGKRGRFHKKVKEGLEGKMDGALPERTNSCFSSSGAKARAAQALLFMYCVPRQLFMTAWKHSNHVASEISLTNQ